MTTGLLGSLIVLVPAAVGPVAPAAAAPVLTDASAIAAGAHHTCAVTSGGAAVCWGDNSRGQLGNGTTADSSVPVGVTGLGSGVVSIAAGGNHTCAVTSASVMMCWGDNTYGQLGLGSAGTAPVTTPGQVGGFSSILGAISVGGRHTCAEAKESGGFETEGVWCWGHNAARQIYKSHDENHIPTAQIVLSPTSRLLSDVSGRLASGGSHSCFMGPHDYRQLDNRVACRGLNADGQLGGSSTIGGSTDRTVFVPTFVDAQSIAAGAAHSCAVAQGTVRCWGSDEFGQLGNGAQGSSMAPVVVSGQAPEAAIVRAGTRHTCLVAAGGAVQCWGDNSENQLGSAAAGSGSQVPVNLAGLGANVTAITAGDFHSCALSRFGQVTCWGSNSDGQLGNGTTTPSAAPVEVAGGLTYGPADPSMSIAVTADEAAVGVGQTIHFHVAVTNTGNVPLTSVAVSPTGMTCPTFPPALPPGAITTIDCTYLPTWQNVGTYSASASVTAPPEITTPVSDSVNVTVVAPAENLPPTISVGFGHACGVTTNGALKCWGANDFGELGTGSSSPSMVPVSVSGMSSGVRSVSAGLDHTCAVRTSGELLCWGENSSGQLGNGTTTPSSVPVTVTGFSSGVKAVAAGNSSTCALRTNGVVSCWGASGLLGNGTSNQSSVPVEFMSGVVSIDVGSLHACAVTAAGAVMCWGNNEQNQLGTPVGTNSLVPVQVTDLGSGYTSVATGGSHTCALSAGGAVKCWGAGTVGNGTSSGSATPVTVTGLSSGVRSISAGNETTCAVLTSGGAKCWGSNNRGMVGNGTENPAPTPVSVTDLPDPVEMAVGGSSCAVTSSWAVKCWGDGPLGDSSVSRSSVPVLVSGGFNFGPPAPALAMAITAQETSVLVGDTIHYEVTLTNVGNMAITNAHVVEIGGLTCPTNPNQALAVGASATTNCVHTAAAGDVGSFGMHGCGIFTEAFTTYCAAQVFVTVAALAPSLAVVKGADETDLLVGDTIHYTIDVVNTGNVALHGVALVDPDADCPTAPAATLAVGESDTVECTHEAVVGDVGTYSNTASATADEVTTPQPSNQVDVEVEAGTPELEVTKAADEASVIEGDTIHYDVTVENTGQVELTEVKVDDPHADCPTEPIATLAVGADTMVECTHVTDGDDVGTYSNTASATSTEVTTPVDSNQVDVTVVAANPSLDVDKAADESAVLVGATIHYDVTLSNTGNVTLHDVVVDDPDADCPSTPIATLAVGADEIIECTHVAVTGDIGTYSNVASATSDEVTTAVDSNQVDVTVSPVPAPALSAVKSADQSSVVAGQPVDYHVVVTNTGNVPLTGITVTDAHAPGCDGPVPDLAVGAAHTVDCAYTTVSPADVGTYSNTASVDSAETSPQDSNTVDVAVVAQAPAVSLSQTVDESTVAAGGAIHYHLTVTNTGNVALSGLSIADANAPACAGPVANLAAGASTTLHCAYTTVNPGDIGARANAAVVTSAQGALAMSNIVITEVTAPAELEVTKSAAQTTVEVDGTIDYEVTVTNTGGSVAHHVTVADANAPDCDGDLGALAPGADVTVECTYVTEVGDIGTYTNVASATATEVTTSAESNQVDVAVTEFPAGQSEVSGTVTTTGSGDPIPGGLVALLSTADFSMAAGFQADAQGHFTGRAAEGDYYAYAIDPEGGHNAGFFGSPTVVTVANSVPATANPSLAATEASITGTVTDETTGDPIERALLLTLNLGAGATPGPGAISGPDGTFTVERAAPGNHLGIFLDLGGGHAIEYSDGAPTAGTATPIAATAGQVTTGVDASMVAQAPPGTGAHLVGNVAAAGSGVGDLEGVAVIALHANTFAFAAGDVTDADGNYDIEVGLGGYRLLFYDPSGDHQAEWFNNVALGDVGSSGIVTATAAQPTKRRDVSLAPGGGVVAGTVTDATTGDPIEGVWAVTIAPNGRLRVAVTGPDGRYRRNRVAVGDNHLTFVNPNGGYVQQYWDDAPTFAAGSILDVIAGDTTTGIDAALRPTP